MKSANNPEPVWPVDITYRRGARVLCVTFTNGDIFDIPAQLLRVESPSAEVQGHTPAQKITVTGKENVGITAIEPVGHYAVKLIFDDGHNTGLFTWAYLHQLGAGAQKT